MSVQETYDRVAEHYAKAFFDELTRKPYDRELLDRFAKGVQTGRVCDIGCGPGHIGRYLKDRGVDAFGLDLSPELVKIARRLNPGMEFLEGNMLALPFEDDTLAGITAFYSIIHLAREEVPQAFQQFYRVLKPGGHLLLSFHGGIGSVHSENWFGEGVSIDATLFTAEEITSLLSASGFENVEAMNRPPYEFEYQSQRNYVWAHKPD